MYEQILNNSFFNMLYAVVTAMAIIACCYLLFRRGNAFAPDIATPKRLYRWAAAFFASIALNHFWYMPLLFYTASDDVMMIEFIGGLLDSMTVFPLAIVVLFAMLQDRERPLWPIVLMMSPITLGMAACAVTRNVDLYLAIFSYAVLMAIGLIIYMVRATRQYGRWLHDNYADLEHKEVWQSFIVLAIVLLVFVIYEFTSDDQVYMYAMQAISVVLICYLLWQVETLSDLSIPVNDRELRFKEAFSKDALTSGWTPRSDFDIMLYHNTKDDVVPVKNFYTKSQFLKSNGIKTEEFVGDYSAEAKKDLGVTNHEVSALTFFVRIINWVTENY